MRQIISITLSFFIGAHVLCAQGTFQNLDFEQATIVPAVDIYNRVQFAAALPGWTGRTGVNIETVVLHNNRFLDSTGIGIHDVGSSMQPIAGNYSVFIQAKYELFNYPNLISASLSQTGLVPVGTRSLRFVADGAGDVQLGGVSLSLTPLQAFAGYTFFGADVTAFAGTTSELRFNILPFQATFLDSIEFSTQPIPEPGVLGLFGLGGLLLGWWSWRRRK